MKFEKPTLPQFKLDADERRAIRDLTNYLQDTANNAESILFLREAIIIDADDYGTICNFVRAISEYDF